MKRIAVLVSGGGTNLQALIDAEREGVICSGKIELVLSNKRDAYALTRAAEAGIKTRTLIRKEYSDNASYSIAMRDALTQEGADLVVYAGFMTILDENVCNAFENKMINVHPALIPSFCGKGFYGLKVHEAALERGVKVTGATCHFVDAGTDTGPIIYQKTVEVLPDDTPKTLQQRVMEQAEWVIMPKAIDDIANGRISIDDKKHVQINR